VALAVISSRVKTNSNPSNTQGKILRGNYFKLWHDYLPRAIFISPIVFQSLML
jgi:hypothetical protein